MRSSPKVFGYGEGTYGLNGGHATIEGDKGLMGPPSPISLLLAYNAVGPFKMTKTHIAQYFHCRISHYYQSRDVCKNKKIELKLLKFGRIVDIFVQT